MAIQDVLAPMKKRTSTPEHGLRRLWAVLEERRKAGLPVNSKLGLARALGISKQAITPWTAQIPIKHVLHIEELTGLDRSVQRPDYYPPAASESHGRRKR